MNPVLKTKCIKCGSISEYYREDIEDGIVLMDKKNRPICVECKSTVVVIFNHIGIDRATEWKTLPICNGQYSMNRELQVMSQRRGNTRILKDHPSCKSVVWTVYKGKTIRIDKFYWRKRLFGRESERVEIMF